MKTKSLPSIHNAAKSTLHSLYIHSLYLFFFDCCSFLVRRMPFIGCCAMAIAVLRLFVCRTSAFSFVYLLLMPSVGLSVCQRYITFGFTVHCHSSTRQSVLLLLACVFASTIYFCITWVCVFASTTCALHRWVCLLDGLCCLDVGKCLYFGLPLLRRTRSASWLCL